MPRPIHKDNPVYVNVGRTVEMELNYIALREETENKRSREDGRGREEEERGREVHIAKKVKGSAMRYRPCRVILVIMVVLSFLLSITATVLGAVAVSQ